MKKKLSVLFVLALMSISSIRASHMTEFLDGLDVFLKKYTANGQVNYAAVKANKTDIAKLTRQISEINIERAPSVNKKAFYINAYNVLVIKELSALYPVSSPLKVPGFFDKKKFKVAGEYMTLNTIEKDRLAKLGNDPRIHFALVCGANGCPKLSRFAFRPEKLEKQLTYRTKLAIKDPKFIRVNNGAKKIGVSEIFKWYKDEFVKNAGSILAFINKYRLDDAKIPEDYSVEFYTYDWSINRKK